MKLTYTVKIDYKTFTFSDSWHAIQFAEMAVLCSERNVEVSIEVKKEAAENE